MKTIFYTLNAKVQMKVNSAKHLKEMLIYAKFTANNKCAKKL